MNNIKRNHSLKFISNNSGILLIEVIISAGIAGILMLSLLAMMQLVNQNSGRVSLGVTKNELINRIRNNAIQLANMQSSLLMTASLGTAGLTPNVGSPNNLVNFNALKDCLPTLATSGNCNKTDMDDERGFKFYLSNGTSEDPAKAIAGEDVYFTLSGTRCDQVKAATPADCPIMAETWAEPFCSNLATFCTKAISLTIRYRIAIRPDFTGNLLMAPIEGEVYLPLTKGIQLSRLLNQNDNPISMNSSGIYTVQKYYGYSDQAIPQTNSGLKFEAILGNPTGLTSMRLQYRALTGIAAAGIPDTQIPASLTSQNWQDITYNGLSADTWTVQLAGAKSNQIINMGSINSTATMTYSPRSIKIGTTDFDTTAEKDKYRWHYNSSGVLTEPQIKSGIYQFRVLASDSNSATIESMNYITVRLVGRPEILTNVPSQPSTTQDRNCINAQKSIQYFLAVADDENLGPQTLKLGATDIAISSVTGTSGTITIPFDLSQVISSNAQNFGYTLTAQNQFSGATINGVTVPAMQKTLNILLNEKAVSNISITSNPTKIRINETGSIQASFTTGSCCNLDPTIAWGYLPAADPLLSGSTISLASCNVNTSNNSRVCSSSVVATGIKENSNPPVDISSTFTFSSGYNACTAGLANTVYSNSASIPVVKLPGIQFYLAESLWLTLPHTTLASGDYSIKPISPVVWVEIDFEPHDEPVTVSIYKTVENTEICQVTFNAGLGLNPVRQSCPIPAGFSGKLSIKRVTTNILNAGESSTDTSFKAKINSSSLKTEHLTCQADITSKFANYTVGSNMPMLNSPWGFDASNNQYPENDAGLWGAGTVKTFKCYDQWVSNVSASTVYHRASDFQYGGCVSSIIGSNPDLNAQDGKDLYTYNTSSLRPWYCPIYQTGIGNSNFTSSNMRYSTYIFPDNPYLDFDSVNAPYVFVVWTGGGGPGNAVWQYASGSGADSSTPQKAWTNFTNDVCPTVSLSQVKLWGIKSTGHSTAETVMKATNNIYTLSAPGYYNYHFMCSYGRWNPVGKASTNWTN